MSSESFLGKTVDNDVLKKNINTPQFARIERRTETRAEETKVETKNQQNIAANSNIEAEKAPTDTEKAILQTKEAKNYAGEAKHSALKKITLKLDAYINDLYYSKYFVKPQIHMKYVSVL